MWLSGWSKSDDHKKISSLKVGGRISGGLGHHHHNDDDVDDDEEKDDYGNMQGGRLGEGKNKNKNKNKIKNKKGRGYGCKGDFTMVRVVVLFPFTKAKKLLKNRKRSSSSSCNDDTRNLCGIPAEFIANGTGGM